MCVNYSRQHPWPNTGIMLDLLMTILVNVGSFSWRKRIKLSQFFVSLRHWWRKIKSRRLNLYGVITMVSMSQMTLRTST